MTGRMPWLGRVAVLACGAGLLAVATPAPGSPIGPVAPDPRIVALVARVDAASLKRTDDALVAFGTRNDFSERDSTATHGVFGARDWIAAQFRSIAADSGGRMSVVLDTYMQPKTSRTPRAVTESSVIATLQGDESGRIYVMSSHYDDCHGHCTVGSGVAPGADDNGSGTSAVIEAARAMAATHFRGTIVFACFDGEELGLWGSDHFAREMAARHAPILAVLNNDVVGNSVGGDGQSEPDVVRVFSQALPLGASLDRVNLFGSESDSPSRELSRFIAAVVPAYVTNFRVRQIFRADRFLRGGDQESFQDAGYAAAVRFTESHENFTHQHQDVRVENGLQYGDLPQYLDAAYLARVTAANVAALASLALGPAAPGNVQLVTKKLGYDSTLRWKQAAGAVSYEIVWRASDAPQWQYSTNVGNVGESTVPVSKDDNVLGVLSVDAAGLRSPVVYPKPVRE